jgi:hypothetical protein
MFDHKSALLGVNQIASRFNNGQPVYVVLGFVQTPDLSDPEEVSVRKSLENIEHGIHFALLRSKRAGCILTAIPTESILLLLNQYVEVGPRGPTG